MDLLKKVLGDLGIQDMKPISAEGDLKKIVEELMTNRPILEHAAEIKETIRDNDTALIIGETGSGKTTGIPGMILEVLPKGSKVAITQPRKVACRSVSNFVASEVGCKVGEEVGYQVRFDDHTSEGTRMNFMTDGILLRQMQQDPLLKEYAAVMVDEAHERSLNIDFILGLLKRTQRLRQQNGLDPLKIIVTSATLEEEKFLNFFDQAPSVKVEGRTFPVDIHYEKEMPKDYTKAAAEKVQSIINLGKDGDILIFMPGQEEINKTMVEIEKLKLTGLMVLPLYGDMSPEDQDRIFAPSSVRKVIVSTNIAETSVTVPGVRHVIDSGLIKQTEFDPQTGVKTLKTTKHAQSGCIQRAGRAGRLAPGECYRLFTEEDLKSRKQYQVPEMLRSNLASVVLMMKSIGIDNVKDFEFVDPPKPEALEQALESLKSLGALDEDEKMTSIGETMAELPLDPHIARMVIEAGKYDCVETVCTIAAFLGGRNVFFRPKDKETAADEAHSVYKDRDSDFLTFLNVWQAYQLNNGDTQRAYEWAQKNFLNFKVLQEVKEIRYQLFKALKRNGIRATENQDPESIGKSIAAGLIDGLLIHEYKHSYRRVKDGVRGIYIHPGSATSFRMIDPKLIIPAEIMETESRDKHTGETRMVKRARTVQIIKPEWIEEVAPQLVRREYGEAKFDEKKGSYGVLVEYYFRGSFDPYLTQFKEVKGVEATKMLISQLIRQKIDLPFVHKNTRTMEMIKMLHLLSNGKIGDFSPDKLFDFYLQRLGNISSSRELAEALNNNEVNLELNLDDYADKKIAEKTLTDNPTGLRLNDHVYRIDYEIMGSGQSQFISASFKIPAKEVLQVKNINKMPSGRDLVVKVIDDSGELIVSMSSIYLEDIKKQVSKYLNKKVWEERKPAEKFIGSLRDFTDKLLPKLPSPESIGVDPLTSEALIAYPAYTISGFYSFMKEVKLKYFMDKEEAEKVQHLTEVEIAKMRAEERGRKSGLDSLLSGEAFKPKPKVPEKQVKANVLKAIADAKKAKFGK
jgi:RNA helicase HrpA